MHRVPFYRRAFLALFVLAFIVLAPAVIFYTSGYRWNPKKGIIERNGTLILDTVPSGASVTLNGVTIPDRTPVTLQNVAPGTYQVHLERGGYQSWEKTLEVRPERVTFVNEVRLWRQTDPSLLSEGRARAIAVSPNARLLAFVNGEEDVMRITFQDVPGFATNDLLPSTPTHALFQDGTPTGTIQIAWNPASSAVLIRDSERGNWIANRSGGSDGAHRLADGVYRWDGSTLIGVREGVQTAYVVSTGATTQTPLPAGVVDQSDPYVLLAATGTTRLSVARRNQLARRYELPDGAWTFADRVGALLFLTNGFTWLGFDPDTAVPEPIRLPAEQQPQVLTRARDISLLARGSGELWIDVIDESPTLLLRTGDALTGATWHEDGADIFYSTERDVWALNLDPRDGRLQTKLATFDRIDGLAEAAETLFISGQRDGRQGVWTLALE